MHGTYIHLVREVDKTMHKTVSRYDQNTVYDQNM